MEAKLTDSEMKIMKILWNNNEGSSIYDVLMKWEDSNQKPGYTTVLKTLQIMEKKGIVSHEKSGRNFIYFPEVTRDESMVYSIRKLLDTFFNGKNVMLANALIANNGFTKEELSEIREMIDKKETEINDKKSNDGSGNT